jgi:hypothetical protein
VCACLQVIVWDVRTNAVAGYFDSTGSGNPPVAHQGAVTAVDTFGNYVLTAGRRQDATVAAAAVVTAVPWVSICGASHCAMQC